MRALLPVVLLATALTGLACDGCADPAGHGPTGGGHEGEGDTGEGEGEGDTGEGEGEGDASLTLVIEPASPVLDATVGGTETLQLTAILVDDQGNRTPAPQAFWASLAPQVGTIDQTGLFSPSRERAGEALVRCRASGVEATTVVRVNLRETTTTGGASSPADFTGPVGATPLTLLYPEDGVVIPANLAPIVVQWNKSHARARVVFEGAFGSLTLYTDGDEAQASNEAWRRFLLAHIGASFSLTVEETDGPGLEIAKKQITVNLAAADLTSTVYYWAVDRGQIVRIDADSLDPIALSIPSASGTNECRACHSLSANGQKMSFTYFGGNEPGGVIDTSGTPVLLDNPGRRWNFSALSPDGSLLVSNFQNRLALRDGLTGDVVPGFADLGVQASQPSFSPTGTMMAFANNIMQGGGVPGWEIDFNTSDLAVADVDPVNRTVSNVRTLVPGNGKTIYFPSFSPDGRLIAYAEGTSSRSVTAADLMLTSSADRSGDAPRVRLDRANPGHSGYAPTFNPKVEGGYMWIAFYSRRPYGHHIPNDDASYAARRPQIWVAAIDANADPATALDPSHPAFWLPGQTEESENLSSFFAPKPCSETGGLCDTDAACCGDGLCRPVNGVSQCVPPSEACTLTGDGCTADADCCDGLNCVFNPEAGTSQCLPPGAVCAAEGQLCLLDADCCDGAGLCTDDGTGTTRCLASSCGLVGDACSASRACCDGEVCASGTCIVVGG
jgi:hypothetical protein